MLHFSKERFALMHFTKFDHQLTTSPPATVDLSKLCNSPHQHHHKTHTAFSLRCSHTDTHTSKQSGTKRHSRPTPLDRKEANGCSDLERKRITKTDEAEEEEQGGSRKRKNKANEPKKKKKGGKEGASLRWQPSRWKTRTQMYADDLRLALSPARVEADEVTDGRLQG